MVGAVGIEPMTSCMSSMRSNQLSYVPERCTVYHNAYSIAIPFSKKVKKLFHKRIREMKNSLELSREMQYNNRKYKRKNG